MQVYWIYCSFSIISSKRAQTEQYIQLSCIFFKTIRSFFVVSIVQVIVISLYLLEKFLQCNLTELSFGSVIFSYREKDSHKRNRLRLYMCTLSESWLIVKEAILSVGGCPQASSKLHHSINSFLWCQFTCTSHFTPFLRIFDFLKKLLHH